MDKLGQYPAFPAIDECHYNPGMNFRDYLAAQAMPVTLKKCYDELQKIDEEGKKKRFIPEIKASIMAYRVADQMLAKR